MTHATTVLVVGGGPVGLSMATLLGRAGVDTVMVERRPGAAEHPRARSINLRTAEIFRSWGIIDDIEAVSLLRPWTEQMIYTHTLAGAEQGRVETATQGVVDGVSLSPGPYLLSSQDQFEPVIRRYAETLPTAELRWETELVDFDTSGDGVTATVRHRPSGDASEIRARWLVAADGAASPIRRQLGVEMEGGHHLATLVNCHFHIDLDRFTTSRPAMLYWTTEPRNVFQKIDRRNRWLCQLGYDPREHAADDFDHDTAARWIADSIASPDVTAADIDVIDVIPWTMSCTVAADLRVGPVFLMGDAAHQLPPSGGFGMNTGVQDAHNLAWKMAWVDRGWASGALLDTYHPERHPTARYNADRSLENSRMVGKIRRSVESGDPAEVADAVEAAHRYGNWVGMDLGLHYDDGWVIPDGTPPPDVDDPVTTYAPCARPGHRAPHVEATIDGRPASTLDLFDDVMVLLTGPDADGWSELADAAARPFVRVARSGVDVVDTELTMTEAYGIGPQGAVLVRPDGHVAWRSPDGPVADTDFDDVLRSLLI